jgi:hypothetical protein
MRCKELASEYNVTPMQVGRLRKKACPDEDGDLSPESEAFIRAYLDDLLDIDVRTELEEVVKPQFVESICSYAQAGRSEVECKMKDDDGIKTVCALVPFKSDIIRMVGRPMKLEVIEYKDVKYYRHASLAGKAWGKMR